jgi:hypothetical protein
MEQAWVSAHRGNDSTRREHPMSKSKVFLAILGTFIFSYSAFPAEPTRTDYSGTWVLDKSKTRNLPPKLQSYTMVVTQTEEQLTVETKVEGDLRPSRRESDEDFPGDGGPPGGPGGEGGFPGGPPDGGLPPQGPGGGPPSGVMALGVVIPSATYSLDGKETTAELEGRMRGTATLKAKWAKDRKTLELAAIRQEDFQRKSVSFTSRETWKLSADGEVLNLQRTVETPRGTDTVKLTFNKKEGQEPEENVQ